MHTINEETVIATAPIREACSFTNSSVLFKHPSVYVLSDVWNSLQFSFCNEQRNKYKIEKENPHK